jgi:hypothetical protein
MEPDKRQFRKLKRDIKRAGNKRRRRHWKRELTGNPEGLRLVQVLPPSVERHTPAPYSNGKMCHGK